MTSPAYIQWVEMVKGDEQKLVHPGNVDNHIRAGWQLKHPVALPAPDTDPASLTLPELTALIVAQEQPAEEESMTESLREGLTPKPRASRKKKDQP